MRRVLILVLGLVLVLTACGGGEDKEKETPIPPTAAPTATPVPGPTLTPTLAGPPVLQQTLETDPRVRAQLRVIHASPDLPAIDLYLEGTNIGSRFVKGLYHNKPLAFEPGVYTLRVVSSGSLPSDGDVWLEYPVELVAGQSISVILLGTADDLHAVVFPDVLDPLPDGKARLSLVHAIPRGAPFDMQEGGQSVLPGTDFGLLSGPVELEDGQHTFDFLSGDQTLISARQNLSEGFAYTLILFGDTAANTYQVISIQTHIISETQMRVVHASPDLPPVNVYLNAEEIASGLEFHTSTEWATFPSISFTLRVVSAADPTAQPFYERPINLLTDQSVALILYDAAERLLVTQVPEDLTVTPLDAMRLTFVNVAVGAAQVQAYEVGGAEMYGAEPISYGTASSPMLVTAGLQGYYFETTDRTNPRIIDTLSEREWAPGTAYLLILTGFPDTEPIALTTNVGTLEQTAASLSATPLVPAATYQMRMVNALPDAGPISLELNGAPIFTDVQPGTTTEYATLDPVQTELTFRDSASGSVLLTGTYVWTGTPRLTLYVLGDLNSYSYQTSSDERSGVPVGQAQVRVVNNAPTLPTLMVVAKPTTGGTETTLGRGLTFERISDRVALSPGTYTITILEHDTLTPLLSVPNVTLESTMFYDVLLLPDSTGLSLNPVIIGH